MNLPKLLRTKISRENLALVGILVILVAIPLTVILLGIRQELRKRAEGVNGSILINNGAATTNSRTVTLTLTAPSSSQSSLKPNFAILKINQVCAATPCSTSCQQQGYPSGTCQRYEGKDPCPYPPAPFSSLDKPCYDACLGTGHVDGICKRTSCGCKDGITTGLKTQACGELDRILCAAKEAVDHNPYHCCCYGKGTPPPTEVNIGLDNCGLGYRCCCKIAPTPKQPSPTPTPPAPISDGCTVSCSSVKGMAVCDVTVTTTADYSGCSFYWDGKSSGGGGCGRFSHNFCSGRPGLHTAKVEVAQGYMQAGAVVGTCTTNVNIDCGFQNATPVCSSISGPSQVEPGSTVSLTAEASDPDGDPLVYGWSASCGTLKENWAGQTTTWTAPSQSMTCTISVYASDGYGEEYGSIGHCPNKTVQVGSGGPTPTPTPTPGGPTPTPTPTPPAGVQAMMISNDGNFQGATEESFAATKSWTLTEGDGLKTVWAKFKVGGVWTTPVSDSITLATGAPTPTPTLPPGVTPTPTPTPPSGTAQCNETCLSAGYQCVSGLQCIQLTDLVGSDKCRNPNCPQEADCVCPGTTPTPTPTPPPGGYLKLDLLKVWFWKQEKALGRGHEGAVQLALKQGGNVVLEKAVPLDGNGEARNVELPGVSAGTYNAFVYEPGYLTKKLSNVTLNQTGNTLDFTKGGTEYFLVGDFNGDQEVNILDFSIFVKSYGKSGEE